MIRRPIFPTRVGMALLEGLDAAPLLLGLPAGKGIPRFMAGWLLAACVCLAVGGATWVLPGVVTDSPANDAIIHAVILGFTILMTTAIAIALAASGSQTKTVSSL